MAQQGVPQESLSCPVCLDLLKDPVALTCGHSFCRKCIKGHWDSEEEENVYSCPNCRQTFALRPDLQKSTVLAALVEDLKKTGLQAAPADHCYAGPEDHRGHHMVSAAAERAERQRELGQSRQNLQQRIQDREKDVKMLQQQEEAIDLSADEAVKDSEQIFTQLIRLLEKRRSDVKQQVRSQQRTEASGVRELQEKLEQEISELKRRDADLEELSHTADHNQFLQDYKSLSALGESSHSSRINIRPLRNFENVTAAVRRFGDKVQDLLTEKWNVSQTETNVEVSPSQPEPRTRAEFLQYARDLTLDPNTANKHLVLSGEDRKVRNTEEPQPHPPHRDRFTVHPQVLSRERLTGRCYWEVAWRGPSVHVALAYENISRAAGAASKFGLNDKSWRLEWNNSTFKFYYKKKGTAVPGPGSSRVGVYLDHPAGALTFYSVGETMTLLHRVQTSFTQPLHAGLKLPCSSSSAELCRLK